MSYKLTEPGKDDAVYAAAAEALGALTDATTGIWIVSEGVPDGMGDTAITRSELERLAREEAEANALAPSSRRLTTGAPRGSGTASDPMRQESAC